MSVRSASALIVVALVAAAIVGRWEQHREIAAENHGMERVVALVGPLDQRALVGYRIQPEFDCLVYRRGSNPVALELCAQRSGRVVEAIDRIDGRRRIYSVRSEPSASKVYVDRAEFTRLLSRMTSS